jgi:hypothetical protein
VCRASEDSVTIRLTQEHNSAGNPQSHGVDPCGAESELKLQVNANRGQDLAAAVRWSPFLYQLPCCKATETILHGT